MAFENINWGAPAQSRQFEQAQFSDMLGRIVQQQNFEKELELRKQQIENKGQSLESKAQSAAQEIAMTGTTSPEGRAALTAWQAFQRPVFNPATQEYMGAPNVLQSLTGQVQEYHTPKTGHFDSIDFKDQEIPPLTLEQLVGQPPKTAPSDPVRLTTGMLQDTKTQKDAVLEQMNKAGFGMGQVEDIRDKKEPSFPEPEFAEIPSKLKGTLKGQEMIFNQASRMKELEYGERLKFAIEKFDDFVTDSNSIPLIKQMIEDNRKTLDMPYAEMVQLPARFLDSDAADALDQVNQTRLELAAPLAKALGVNPTDKDFQASLERIVNLNSTKKGREQQLKGLLKRIEQKHNLSSNAPTREQIIKELKRRGAI